MSNGRRSGTKRVELADQKVIPPATTDKDNVLQGVTQHLAYIRGDLSS
jgi:hypothetical protein